jgi:nucleoside 2-deoxyribosyltransferase
MNRLRVLQGGVGSHCDPRQADPQGWNREWTPRQHCGTTFRTETAHVDVVSPKSTHGARIFIGGSRTFSDRTAVAERLRLLPRDAIVLTSPTYGASAAARDLVQERGLPMEVWIARLDRFPTEEAAYFARDEEMIQSADRVIAFWDGGSSGTAHELDYARQIGKPVELVNAFEPGPRAAGEVDQSWRALPLPLDRSFRPGPPPDRDPGGDAA